VVGRSPDGKIVRAGDLHAQAAMTALLRDAIMPNLVQTREGSAAFIHGGPFGNIAHGCSSIAQTKLALAYGDEVVTEAGFGFDLGGEKFLNIKCRTGGLWPRMAVVVATLRALRHHGGADAKSVSKPDRAALVRGLDHVSRHLESLQTFGLPAVVVLNKFQDDPEDEIAELRAFTRNAGVEFAACDSFARGGEGALDFADRVLDVLNRTDASPATAKFSYPLDASLEAKITAVAQQVYGARDVVFASRAKEDLAQIVALGGASLPVCMAKTHLSLSDDPTKRNRPRDFTITVREARLSAGAGFVVALTGEIVTMPGLPKEPSAWRVSVAPDGTIQGVT
jgi:formate--tetrahydrofolate ligase